MTNADYIVRYLPLKEARNDYYVEYCPPHKDCRFATLNIVFLEKIPDIKIVKIMEEESRIWTSKYPIPLMISSFDNTESLITLDSIKKQNYLISFLNEQSGVLEQHWEDIHDNDMPSIALDNNYCEKIFLDFKRLTRSEIDAKNEQEIRSNKLGLFLLIIWAVVIPSIVLLIEFNFPTWLSTIVLGYSLFKAVMRGLKIAGKMKPSKQEKRLSEEEQLKNHHHYYCLKNPEGFLRLKCEVIDKESRDKVFTESAELQKIK